MQGKEIIDLAKRKASENGFEGEAADAFVSAFVENFKKGYAEGEKKAKIETARSLLSMGLTVEQIAQGTGLSIEDVEKLK